MSIEALNEKTLDEYYKALYFPIGAMEVPRHLNWYACYLYNEKADKQYNVGEYQNYHIDRVLNTAIVNKCMSGPIINYSYKPKNGYIKPTKKAIVMDYQAQDGFAEDITNTKILYRHNIPHFLKASYPNKGNVALENELEEPSFKFSNQLKHNYYQSIDAYTFLNAHSGEHGSFRNQPQVHVGLIATPALNPALDTNNFLNSAVYTVTNVECFIEFNMESMCVDSETVEWPEDVKFFMDVERGYTGYGYQNYGLAATFKPRLESVRPGRGEPRKRTNNLSADSLRRRLRKIDIQTDESDYVVQRPRSPIRRSDRMERIDEVQSLQCRELFTGDSDNSLEYEIVYPTK